MSERQDTLEQDGRKESSYASAAIVLKKEMDLRNQT